MLLEFLGFGEIEVLTTRRPRCELFQKGIHHGSDNLVVEPLLYDIYIIIIIIIIIISIIIIIIITIIIVIVYTIIVWWYTIMVMIWLVVCFNPSEKYEFVNWDDDTPNWMEK